MIAKGIPFIFFTTESENSEQVKGIRTSLIGETHSGNYKGILAAGLGAGTDSGKDSIDSDSDLEGVCAGGAFSIIDGDLRGAVLAGATSVVHGELNGFSYGTLVNYAKGNGKLAVQIGAVNHIRDYFRDGTVIQLGLYNRAGEQIIPLVNIRGLKNLFRKNKEPAREIEVLDAEEKQK